MRDWKSSHPLDLLNRFCFTTGALRQQRLRRRLQIKRHRLQSERSLLSPIKPFGKKFRSDFQGRYKVFGCWRCFSKASCVGIPLSMLCFVAWHYCCFSLAVADMSRCSDQARSPASWHGIKVSCTAGVRQNSLRFHCPYSRICCGRCGSLTKQLRPVSQESWCYSTLYWPRLVRRSSRKLRRASSRF